MRALRGYTLDRPKIRCVVADSENIDMRLLLLEPQPEVKPGASPDLESLPLPVQHVAAAHALSLASYDLLLDYSHLNADQALKRLLPSGVDAPNSFETVGHIIHLNLREDQLPHKHTIGQVLLDKNPHVHTVVNKVGAIDNEFRVFTMELLAGEPRTETEVVQHGAHFRLDFAQVYWNSRLEAEHHRLVAKYFQPGQVVVDMMAGIGPFAIPAAQAGCTVYANDLNPSSTAYMAANVRLNHLASRVHVFNMDGRAFLRLLCDTQPQASGSPSPQQPHDAPAAAPAAVAAQTPSETHTSSAHLPAASVADVPTGSEACQPVAQLDSRLGLSTPGGLPDPQGAHEVGPAAALQPEPGPRKKSAGSKPASRQPPPLVTPQPAGFTVPAGGLKFQHVVMNLPASAVEFLDAFQGAFNPDTWPADSLPWVHVYTFQQSATETDADIVAKCESYLGGKLDSAAAIHQVRDVSPNKLMLCVSFRLPAAVAFNGAAPSNGCAAEHEHAEDAGVQGDVHSSASHHDAKRPKLQPTCP